jgi:hypothetical protein
MKIDTGAFENGRLSAFNEIYDWVAKIDNDMYEECVATGDTQRDEQDILDELLTKLRDLARRR